MTGTFARDPGCDACRRITSGDCGMHGPITVTNAWPPRPAVPMTETREAPVREARWPHRPVERRPQEETDARGDLIHEADHRLVCANDRSRWPCPSQQYLDSVVAAVRALPKWDKRSVPGGFHVNRAAVLALLGNPR